MMLLCTGISFDSFTLQSVKCHRRNGGKRLQSTEMAGSSGWKWREVVAGGKKGGKVQVRGVSGIKSGGRPTAAFVPLLLLCAPNIATTTTTTTTTTTNRRYRYPRRPAIPNLSLSYL